MGRMAALVPEVLRTEAQFRLLFAGPAIAGVLVGSIGAGAAMLFDAGSFAVSVACLLRLRPAVAVEGIEQAPPAFLAAVMTGWREVRSRSWVLAGLGAMCAYSGIV